jgi:hypothetical protein
MIYCIAGITEGGEVLTGQFKAKNEPLAHVYFGRDYQDYEFVGTYCTVADSWGMVRAATAMAARIVRDIEQEGNDANTKNT